MKRFLWTAQKTRASLYEWFAVAFITILIVSNIASVKMVAVGSIVFDAGTILFPISYIIGDIITEIYGFRRMRSLLLKGIVMLVVVSLIFWVVGMLPTTPEWGMQESYDNILGIVWRIVFASIVAIFVGELMNGYILARLKIATKGKGLWYRLVGSSAVGNALDTVIFSTLAFVGTVPFGTLLQLIVSVYLIKMTVEIVASPLTMRLIAVIKKHEKVDTYETPKLF